MSGTKQQELELAIETLIDKHDLARVLDAIEAVCHEKADHIHENGDARLALFWGQAGERVGRCAESNSVVKVSVR